MYIFTGSEKLIRIFRSALYNYTEVPSWTKILKQVFSNDLVQLCYVSSVTSNIILILYFVPNYIHQSIVSKSTRILVLSEMHDVVLRISGTIQ